MMVQTFRLTDVLTHDLLQQCARIVVEKPPNEVHQTLLREVVLPNQEHLVKALDGLDPDWFADTIEGVIRRALKVVPMGGSPTT